MIRAARHLAECPALAARTFGSADQLARLGNCIRAICEKAGDLRWSFPDLEPEDRVTWDSETSWLLATMSWWTTEPRCREWISIEVEAIRQVLVERIERANGWTACALCGGKIETWSTETLDVAECKRCDRVISMRERHRKARRHGLAVIGLDCARAKLGLPETNTHSHHLLRSARR